jgi:hypothetical protein
MSAKNNPDPAIPDGYRTLVPGNRVPVPSKSEPKPAGTPEAATRPAAQSTVKPPAQPTGEEKPHDDPTRFGDWEVKGRCIDF